MLEGLRHDLVDVLLVPAAPVGIVGLIALVALWRSPALREASPLRALVIAGVLTFVFTSLVFPIATQWGTYQHAAGPMLVALIVLAMLGLDAVVAWIGRRRGWSRDNAWLAPLAMLVLVLPLAVLFVRLTGVAAEREMARQAVVAGALSGVAAPGDVVITDHPMWLAEATDLRTAALPDEPIGAVADLADALGARWLLVLDDRGDYPDALLSTPSPCFVPTPIDAAGAQSVAHRTGLPPMTSPQPVIATEIAPITGRRQPTSRTDASGPVGWHWPCPSSRSGSCRCATRPTSTSAGTSPTGGTWPTACSSAASTSTPGRLPARRGSRMSG